MPSITNRRHNIHSDENVMPRAKPTSHISSDAAERRAVLGDLTNAPHSLHQKHLGKASLAKRPPPLPAKKQRLSCDNKENLVPEGVSDHCEHKDFDAYAALNSKHILSSDPLSPQCQNSTDLNSNSDSSHENDAVTSFRSTVFRPMEPGWNSSISKELHDIVHKYSRDVLDENDEDTFDVTMVAEYAPEIFNHMRELEVRLAPNPKYMEHQEELKWETRAVLIDWVVQVHLRFNLLPETLYLTVNYIDRFLSRRKVLLSRFQLVGAVALFIAAKYEEINCPTVQEVAYMADNAYLIDEFLKAERFMIDVLEFDMGWPGPMSFLRRTSKADDYDYETRTLAKYFLEISIMDARLVALPPSWLAAGAHYLSRQILNKGSWTELHTYYSGYTELQIRPLAERLVAACHAPRKHHKAIFEKYQEKRYRRSSLFVEEYLQAMAI